MAYLAIKKVKGSHYAYLQESYREGGRVKTRTVEYLGAVNPAVAGQVITTRKQLGKADMAALVQSVREHATAATTPPSEPEPPKLKIPELDAVNAQVKAEREAAKDLQQNPIKHIRVNGDLCAVNMLTGELVANLSEADKHSDPAKELVRDKTQPFQYESELDDQTEHITANGHIYAVDTKSGEILSRPKQVITTAKRQTKTQHKRQDVSQRLKYPKDISEHKVSTTAIKANHRRFESRLIDIGIDPATMPTVRLKYSHPDGLSKQPDGSYTITISRHPGRAHSVGKAKLWANYRTALASAYLDTIEAQDPGRWQAMEHALNDHHQRAKLQVHNLYKHSKTNGAKFWLSLQLTMWNAIPKEITKAEHASDYAQVDFQHTGNWRAEAVHVLANVSKSGWDEYRKLLKNSRQRLKTKITKSKNSYAQKGLTALGDKLSGKRAKAMREIMEAERRLRSVDLLEKRLQTLKTASEFRDKDARTQHRKYAKKSDGL